jgi:hypothetical protein
MGLTFIQQAPENQNGGSSNSLAQAYTTNTTAGSLLLAHGLMTVAGTLSVTDSRGNTWTQIGTYSGVGGQPVGVFFAINASAGPNTVTLHATSIATLTLFLAEYTGQAAGANPIDAVLGDILWSETGTGTVNFGSIATAFTNETLILFGRSASGGSQLTAQDGSTVRTGTNSVAMLQDRSVSAAGTYPSAFSTSLSGNSGPGIFFGVKTLTSNGPAATPTYSPVAGSYGSAQSVTITCTTPSSTITYTTDGTTPVPGSHGTVYSGPVSVTTTQTIKAVASATNFVNSAEADATYTIGGVLPVSADGPMISALFPVLMARMRIAAAYRNRNK